MDWQLNARADSIFHYRALILAAYGFVIIHIVIFEVLNEFKKCLPIKQQIEASGGLRVKILWNGPRPNRKTNSRSVTAD